MLPLQAILLFWRLDLLSPWFDEADTLLFMRGPIGPAIAIPASGLHPPLYFALLWCWMRLPLGLGWTVQARTLSVLFTLTATWAFDRLWARRLEPRLRCGTLALWTLSPFLLLYGRMSRSYTLQLLLGVVGAALIVRFCEKRTRANFAALAATLVVALYTHYIPGIALAGAANVALLRRGRWRDAAGLDLAALAALAPWMAWLIPQLAMWSVHHVPYSLTGGIITETVLKLGYWAMSFSLGEAIPDAMLAAGAAIVAAVLWLLFLGWRRDRELRWLALTAAAIGFLGVTRWVSYPFVPARMIFLYPLFLIFAMMGAAQYRKFGSALVAAILLASIAGVWCYFHLEGFRNKEYPMPMDEIAARIRASGSRAVLVDATNSDAIGLQYALGGDRPLQTEDPRASGVVAHWLADPSVRTMWFLRSTHDVSAEGLDDKFEKQMGAGAGVSRFFYEPFSAVEMRVTRGLGVGDASRYFQELVEYRK